MAYTALPSNFDTLNESQKNSAAISAGYTGLNDYNDQKNRNIQGQGVIGVASPTGGVVGGSGGTAGMFGATAQPTINLPGLYDSLYKTSGVAELEKQYSDQQKAFNDQTSKINNNPFLSEASRIGRGAKLQIDFNNNTANTKNDIATKKADIQTQLALQTKQFDINSQAAQTAFNQFQSLLSSGALAGASGNDIASITQSTGIPSGIIQSAIAAQTAKQNPVKSTIIQSTDDQGNLTFAVINEATGEILNQKTIEGVGKVTKATGGGGGGTGTGTTKPLTPEQLKKITASSRQILLSQDPNKDKLISKAEYTNAVSTLMSKEGVSFEEADNYAAQAFSDLGFKKWNW